MSIKIITHDERQNENARFNIPNKVYFCIVSDVSMPNKIAATEGKIMTAMFLVISHVQYAEKSALITYPLTQSMREGLVEEYLARRISPLEMYMNDPKYK
ncbi:hypothetical protein ACKJSM_11540 [Pseudomonas sp. PHC1]|uniref:hypothetical protein n=1 Tax=Pseudomonas sp. PHC1 TaxID=3384759 RepID=UPI00396F5A99